MIIPDKEDGKVEVNSKIPHQATPEVSQALSFLFWETGPGQKLVKISTR